MIDFSTNSVFVQTRFVIKTSFGFNNLNNDWFWRVHGNNWVLSFNLGHV